MIKHPYWVVIVCLIGITLLSIGAKDLYFRGDYKIFFKPDNPQRLAFEEMQGTFSKNENVGIVIAPKSRDVFSDESLRLIKRISDAAWQTPLSTRVDSITNFQHTYAEDDDLVVEDLLLEEDWLNQERIAFIKEVALQEPELLNKIVSPSGHVSMVNITVRLPDGDQTKEIEAVSSYVRGMLAEFETQYSNHRFYLTGMVIMNDAAQIAAYKDASTLFPLMFLLITLLLMALLRSVLAALATLFIVFVSITATMGVAGWNGIFLSMATVNAPIMVMTLAVADCIHLVSSMRYNMQQGQSKQLALSNSLAINLRPIIITSVTTAIGFLTLNFAEVPILSDLGNIAALGVVIACVLSLSLLPALISILPIHFKPLPQSPELGCSNKSEHQLKQDSWSNRLCNYCLSHARPIVWIGVLLSVCATYLSFTNELNDIAIEYFDKRSEFRQHADFQQDNLTGLSNIDFGIYTGTASGVNDPQTLITVDAFGDWLRAQPEVDHVSTIINTYKRLNQNMHNDDPNYYRLPREQNEAAQYLLLYEMSLPFGLDVNNQLDINKSATRVVATLKNLGSVEFTGFETRAKTWFAEHAPELRVTAASPPLMFAHIGAANMEAMIEGALLAVLLISILLIFALKSVKLGLISLIPNMLPAALGFGVWALISGEINMALSVVLSMTMGIVVDDTVHFLSKFQHAQKQGQSVADSLRFTFNSVGNALLITTVVLACGFAVLTLSDFSLNSDMGLLTAIIIALALLIDLVFLPAMLFVLGPYLDREVIKPATTINTIDTK